jgi:hypothetical protein
MTLRALCLTVLAGACVVGLAIVSAAPAKSQRSGISSGVDVKYPGLVKELASRRGQYRYARESSVGLYELTTEGTVAVARWSPAQETKIVP